MDTSEFIFSEPANPEFSFTMRRRLTQKSTAVVKSMSSVNLSDRKTNSTKGGGLNTFFQDIRFFANLKWAN
ncbi:MAG TPA: hypothetical protein VGK38_02330 [Prolixibacteraceae bacterium]